MGQSLKFGFEKCHDSVYHQANGCRLLLLYSDLQGPHELAWQLGNNNYVIGTRGSCMLHEWFAQNYPEPDSYKAYQAEIPF